MAKTTIHRLLSRRDIPLRERALRRMLYETAARASEILALNVEDLDLEHRRAPVRSKGSAVEWVYWDSGTAHLLPRLLRLPDGSTPHPRSAVPVRTPPRPRPPPGGRQPLPAHRPRPARLCARILLDKYASLDLHQLRHSAATHLGDAEIPLQLIMGKTGHKTPAPPCATSNPVPKPSPRPPRSSRPGGVPTDQQLLGEPRTLPLLSYLVYPLRHLVPEPPDVVGAVE
ncbi:site-specific integrase [Nonomuraea antimicrobica]|uniref:site-specific integrase n=1 Tax=Nonomuraea antimicrobica TaxID=561173 RepID=UPI0031EEBBDA